MYEQDFSPMDKSIFQKYEPSNLLFSDAFRANYAYNTPSAALYANSPLGGLGGNFSSHSQQYAQSTFAAVALNALSNVPPSTSGNTVQSTFSLHHHQNQLNENTPARSEHTSLEETQNHLEEQNSAEEEHIAALQAQHNVQSSSTIPNYPNYNSSNNNINSAINSNNVTGSTNININGSNSMNFSAQQNLILKKHLNDQPLQQQPQQNQNSQLSIPSIPTGQAAAVSSSQTQGATAGAASAQFMGNNQAFRFQYQALDENFFQAHSNYPGTPYYESLNQNNDNQNSINYQYNQHTNSPNYSYQQAPGTAQIQPTPCHQSVTGSQQNYSFSTAQSSFKKNSLPTNFFYDSPRNYGASFLPYTPPMAQQNSQSGFSQFIQNQQFPTEINIKQQQIFPEQDECSSYPFLSTPVHQIEQQQNQQQTQQQQPLIAQSQTQKSGLNLLQKQQQLQKMQRYHHEKAQLQQQQMQYTEQALLEQQQHQQQIQNQTQYPNFSHHPQYIQQQQPSQFSNLLLPGNKLIPIQPSPLSIKQNAQDVSKIVMQAALKGKDQVEEQHYQETQESIENEDEENEYQNGDGSVDEDNQDGDDVEDEDDEEYGGSKKKGNNGSNKIKKGISKNQLRNKHTSISAISSSSLQNQTNHGSSSKMSRKQINETKNIPKNYSKAIIGYIQKHPDDCARLLGPEYSYDEFDKFLMDKKEKLTAIKDLRSLWTTNCGDQTQQAFNRVFRILSFKFFRENAVSYIYSSRKIKNTRALITYRFILQRALHDPESFSFMKFQN
ncbi:hypothetical protein ABPG72_013435 [Tetrahymena utriculariae]